MGYGWERGGRREGWGEGEGVKLKKWFIGSFPSFVFPYRERYLPFPSIL
jgi:hypothetical protein